MKRNKVVIGAGVLCTLALLVGRPGAQPGPGQALELKLWPRDRIYAYTIAEPWLRDINLQNVAIINRSDKPVTLEHLEIAVLKEGRVMQKRLLPFGNLEGNLKTFFTKHKSGELKVWETEFHLDSFFSDATLAGSAQLGPNEGITVRDQYFAFNDQVDTVQVTVVGKGEDGAVVEASAQLPLDNYAPKTNLRLPLRGTWQVANGPFPYVSHRWIIHQEFAYDFWKLDAEGKDHKGDGRRYEDYYSYGQPVIVPADATVYEVRNDGEDAPIMNNTLMEDQAEFYKQLTAYRDKLLAQGGYRELLGNYVILDYGNGEYSVLVHFRKGSIRVKKGDKVKQGDLLGLIGNSGLSNVPHLHCELVTGPDLPQRRGLPLRLVVEDEPKPRLLRFGEFVRNGATGSTQRQQD